jgi:hypothetical protein
MKTIMLLAFLFLAGFSQAQTKRIAHYSHGGTAENFEAALANNSLSIEHSNFGDIPIRYVRNARLDSLIAIDENRVVMITSEVCVENFDHGFSSVWSAGRDTFTDHPLFTPQMSEIDVTRIIKDQYYFDKNESTVVVGFGRPAKPNNYQAPTPIQIDEPRDSIKKQNLLPVTPGANQNPPRNAPKFWILLAATLAMFAALINMMYTKANRVLHTLMLK